MGERDTAGPDFAGEMGGSVFVGYGEAMYEAFEVFLRGHAVGCWTRSLSIVSA